MSRPRNGRAGHPGESAGAAAESRPHEAAHNRRWSLLPVAVLIPVLLLALVAIRGVEGASSSGAAVPSTTTAGDLVPEAATAGQLEPGASVPEFSVSTLSGGTFRMPSGQPTVLTFVDLCPTCIGDAQTIGALQQRFSDVAVLAVASDPTADAARVQEFMQQAGDPPFALALDPDSTLTRAFDAFSMAASVVVTDASGRITYRGPAREEALVSALRAAGARG